MRSRHDIYANGRIHTAFGEVVVWQSGNDFYVAPEIESCGEGFDGYSLACRRASARNLANQLTRFLQEEENRSNTEKLRQYRSIRNSAQDEIDLSDSNETLKKEV